MTSSILAIIAGLVALPSLWANWRQRVRLKKLVRFEIENEQLKEQVKGQEQLIKNLYSALRERDIDVDALLRSGRF